MEGKGYEGQAKEARGESNTIQKLLEAGETIYMPVNGVGTGRGELTRRAPKIAAYIATRFAKLTTEYT